MPADDSMAKLLAGNLLGIMLPKCIQRSLGSQGLNLARALGY
jgi:hypothetical protein